MESATQKGSPACSRVGKPLAEVSLSSVASSSMLPLIQNYYSIPEIQVHKPQCSMGTHEPHTPPSPFYLRTLPSSSTETLYYVVTSHLQPLAQPQAPHSIWCLCKFAEECKWNDTIRSLLCWLQNTKYILSFHSFFSNVYTIDIGGSVDTHPFVDIWTASTWLSWIAQL